MTRSPGKVQYKNNNKISYTVIQKRRQMTMATTTITTTFRGDDHTITIEGKNHNIMHYL